MGVGRDFALHESRSLQIATNGAGFYRLGPELSRVLEDMRTETGLLFLFLAHTSASLCVQENNDPDVLSDLMHALRRLAPESGSYLHRSEGPDDMPAHIKTLLTATSLSLPVREGHLALGTWQQIYLIEHRSSPQRRRLELDFIGKTPL